MYKIKNQIVLSYKDIQAIKNKNNKRYIKQAITPYKKEVSFSFSELVKSILVIK